MRLCLVTPGFSASESDWCIPALHHLVRRLSEKHGVTVLALRHPPRRVPFAFFGARVLALGAGRRTGVTRAVMLARALAAVRRVHRLRPLDAVHGLWADEAGLVAAIAGRLLGIRSVASVLGGELVGLPDIDYGVQLGRTGRALVRRSLAMADVVTIGSRALAEPARALRAGGPVELAPLGVDTGLFRPDGERADLEGDPCLLQVASLTPVKGQALLLDAVARVVGRHPAAHLHLVGDGPLAGDLAERAAALGIAGRVRLHRHVEHHRLPPIYRAADLHVVSSRFESQGMAVLEAAACGTASVGTSVGILPELEEHGAALTVTPKDPEALADALVAVVREPDRMRAMAHRAAELVRRELDLEGCVRRLVELYRGGDPGRSRPPSRC
ncbi:MAG TPA: glycosyltransferase family 4 protein [Candidatus Sulfomarinibacteraceae bacterium]|nr:glycosyltransferase family 4 protein [Candidatus Sulfomarinibacteraceae bacterium]